MLELYSLDSRLARERTRLVELRIRAAEVKGELAAARQQLRVAQHTLKVSERSLANRLQLLYEQGDTDPLAVLVVTIAGGALFGAVALILAAPMTSAIVRISADVARARAAEATMPVAAFEMNEWCRKGSRL